MSGDAPLGLLLGLVHFCLLFGAGWALLSLSRRHRGEILLQRRLFTIAFGLRFALAVLLYAGGWAHVFGDEDAVGWYGGLLLQERWAQQRLTLLELPFALLEAFEQQNRGYWYLLGGYFHLTGGGSRFVAAALNVLFGSLTVVFAYRAAATLFSPWVARRVGWWTCLFPSMLIWSAMTVKEPVVILLETIALYACLRMREVGATPRHLLLCILTTVLLIPFRFYAGYLVAAAVLASLLVPRVREMRRMVAGAVMVCMLLPILLSSGILARHEAQFEQFNLQRVQSFRTAVASGGEREGAGSGVKTGDITRPGGLIGGLAIGAAHLLLAPFPWQLGSSSLRMLLTLPELIFWWWLFFAGVLPGTIFVIRHRLTDTMAILLLLLGFGLLYSLMFGNVGLVFRQRAQLLPWLLILGAVGLEQHRLRRAVRATSRAPVSSSIERVAVKPR